MVQTDPIADMLTIMRNGLMVKKESVKCPYSTVKEGILGVLVFTLAGALQEDKLQVTTARFTAR